MATLTLGFELSFEDLYDESRLPAVDRAFLDHLAAADAEAAQALTAARQDPAGLGAKEEAAVLRAIEPHFESFIATLFGIQEALAGLKARHDTLAPIYECKRLFVQRRAAKKIKPEAAREIDIAAVERELSALTDLDQLSFATSVVGWMADEEANARALELALHYAAWAVHTPAGHERHGDDDLFFVPGRIDFNNLVPTQDTVENGVVMRQLPLEKQKKRDGFALTDEGADLVDVLGEANYCVFCHNQGRDSCSKGLRDKKTGAFQVNPLGITLAGCPLEEKISEMQMAKAAGFTLAALGYIADANPMAAGTGHRICNDCMKSCIYQKQEPVNIPQVETRVLKDTLNLPWGFEIYSLLTRWNPFSLTAPLAKPDSGYKVLVAGLGPAGYTLAHHLMNQGHTVVAIDGLKLEPLAPEICGVGPRGERVAFKPIEDVNEIFDNLDKRTPAGFGGVAEYGITVRWNKNLLKVLRLLLERRQRFAMFGGVRLGGTLTPQTAFEMGFDHIALCLGAGKPTLLPVPNGLARGVRMASDFLMGLQLTGAAKADSVTNLQLRLPVVVIGGGLTAIDTATEALAYYVRQVEKFVTRYDILVAEKGEPAVRATWSPEDTQIAEEFIAHGRAVVAEREQAAREGRTPFFTPLLHQWGGATIAYRRRMLDAPSYTLNHEEIEKAMQEGIHFSELLAPLAIDVDEYGHVNGIQLARQTIGEDGRPTPTGEQLTLPARAVLVAAGTKPNTVLARELPEAVELDGRYFQACDENGEPVTPEKSVKPETPQVLMNLDEAGRAMSFFGDLHPAYAVNVVKAMASARQGAPVVGRVLARKTPSAKNPQALIAEMNDGLRARVERVERLNGNTVEVIIRAPIAAHAFEPGQFYRLQNYTAHAITTEDTSLAMEGVALTGAWTDKENGLISLIVLEMGGSSSLVSWLQPGEPVLLMGPTGTPTTIPANETVLLAGGGLGNAVLMAINIALRAAGPRVLYFAAYKQASDVFHVEDIEAGADVLVWCSDTAPQITPNRPQDKSFHGNIVEAMLAYGKGELGETDIPLGEVDRMIVIGSDRMMNAVVQARRGVLAPFLKPDLVGVASINSPMQCMMKEVCAQCLQPHKDPDSGEESVVFSCFDQDQPMEKVDFAALNQRLRQNAVQEKLTAQWIAHSLAKAQGRTHV